MSDLDLSKNSVSIVGEPVDVSRFERRKSVRVREEGGSKLKGKKGVEGRREESDEVEVRACPSPPSFEVLLSRLKSREGERRLTGFLP